MCAMCVISNNMAVGSACCATTCRLWEHFSIFEHTKKVVATCVSTWRSQTKGRPVCAIAMSKLTKCTTPFQRKHALEFELQIVELEKKGNMSIVMGMHFLFYVYHGRDVEPTSPKHKLSNNIHIFRTPFIKQHYLSHLK